MNKNTKRVLWGLSITLVLALVLYPKFQTKTNGKPVGGGPPGAAGRMPVPVRVHVVQPEVLDNSIQVIGTLLANESIDVVSEIAGKIQRIYFREGAHVARGTLLAKINDSELQAQLRKAETRRKLAEEKERRQKRLLEIEGLSREEYELADAELQAVLADIQLLKAQIAKTEIRAPFSGTLGLKLVSEGSYVTPSAKITTLQNINPIKVDFAIPERYAPVVKPGDLIRFRIQSDTEEFTGRIFAVEPEIDYSTRTLPVRAIAANPQGRIVPGSFADVQVLLRPVDGALMIPTEALIPDINSQKVFLYKNGKAVEQKVSSGVRTAERVQITSGIAPGDTVITTGLLQIKPNGPVKIAKG